MVVSIHAPRCRGAKPSVAPSISTSIRGYNPRSPLPGSEASQRMSVPISAEVSIHAPRCRGAKRGFRLCPMPIRRFNPRSPLPGSEAIPPQTNATMDARFQSTLPVAGERSHRVAGWLRVLRSFNPRSPLPGSEAAIRVVLRGVRKVSIHAPRCRGAKQFTAGL